MTCSLPKSARRRGRKAALAKAISGLVLLAAVAACSSQAPPVDQSKEAAVYQAHARGNYLAPGPESDPWGPYVSEASGRFDVPERWIREVMHVESGGQLYRNGELITSRAGAMGLMQVMPETYDELRVRYELDGDAYDPHNNVLAGAAYLREMYDIYGSPGFLAAYNAGPKRLDDYLANVRPLPEETRHYVAMIGPNIEGSYPVNRSPAEQYAMNDLPVFIPPGLRYGGRSYEVAESRPAPVRYARVATRTQYASARYVSTHYASARYGSSHAPVRTAFAEAPSSGKHHGGFGLIEPAMAETVPMRHGAERAGGNWAVQVGAFGNQGQARTATGMARERGAISGGEATVASVHQASGTLYRARINGLSREGAMQACHKLSHNCMVVSPNARS